MRAGECTSTSSCEFGDGIPNANYIFREFNFYVVYKIKDVNLQLLSDYKRLNSLKSMKIAFCY